MSAMIYSYDYIVDDSRIFVWRKVCIMGETTYTTRDHRIWFISTL